MGVDVLCQKAPSAKRCIKTISQLPARRPGLHSQKARSAKRCIKTLLRESGNLTRVFGQKAPSAKRCIKTCISLTLRDCSSQSESTERQTVH